MGDVLSQNEIDNLLAALSTGELDVDEIKDNNEKKVKEYDFARPSKFSKEHLRTMEMIFEHYGRLLSTNLPVYLRKNVQVEVVNSEAVTYSEFSNALSNPVLLGIVNFAPLKGNIILEMASNLGYAIVDRMLGGRGDPMDKVREFSEIELLIIERIMIVCVNLLREPWENVADIHPRLERIETNSQYAQIISPSEMIAIVTINLKIGEVEGLMNVCLPYLTLEDVIDKLNTKYWYSNLQNQDNTDYTESIETLIRRAQIPVKAVLGNSMISVNDFAMLQPGDIIRLDRKVEDELDIYVGNIRTQLTKDALSGTYTDISTKIAPAPTADLKIIAHKFGYNRRVIPAHEEPRTRYYKEKVKDNKGNWIERDAERTVYEYVPASTVYDGYVDVAFHLFDPATGKIIFSLRDTRSRTADSDTTNMWQRMANAFVQDLDKAAKK